MIKLQLFFFFWILVTDGEREKDTTRISYNRRSTQTNIYTCRPLLKVLVSPRPLQSLVSITHGGDSDHQCDHQFFLLLLYKLKYSFDLIQCIFQCTCLCISLQQCAYNGPLNNIVRLL